MIFYLCEVDKDLSYII